jgi:hypothetical protein
MLDKTLTARGYVLPAAIEATAPSASVLPVTVAVGGGVLVVVGGVLAFVGLSPAIDYQRASDAYGSATTIEDKLARQQDAQAAQAAYDSGGNLALLGGSALMVVGLGAGVGGALWALQGE